MNALRLPAFFENLGHSSVTLSAGGGAFGHKDGPKQGATSCRQGEEAWKLWKAYYQLEFGSDVGYLPDGTSMHKAGSMNSDEGMTGPDPHVAGSPLPRALFVNDIGCLQDGTPMNKAGILNDTLSWGMLPIRTLRARLCRRL